MLDDQREFADTSGDFSRNTADETAQLRGGSAPSETTGAVESGACSGGTERLRSFALGIGGSHNALTRLLALENDRRKEDGRRHYGAGNAFDTGLSNGASFLEGCEQHEVCVSAWGLAPSVDTAMCTRAFLC